MTIIFPLQIPERMVCHIGLTTETRLERTAQFLLVEMFQVKTLETG